MTVVHCEIRDCENNEELICRAGAIRLTGKNCCLTYQGSETGANSRGMLEGDRLTWDREYLNDDPFDDDLNI